ncbi:MAG TPA: class I SAM-dependent methyltransferase [Pyrinomonadaceae bacterium]|nr:class I SAM-dependent methyltransferase [Pyrinomonadaceae bacterium]
MSHVQSAVTLDEWRKTATYWARHHHTIRTMFAPLTRALIEHAGIVQGQSILDVAGGAGEPSLTIAETVGPQGSVMCTDPVAEMVEAAEVEAATRALTNVEFRQCTADALPFPDNSFDAVVSRLGVMFFPDPVIGLREMLRVTKPGGRIALAVWHKSELNPYSYLVTGVISRHVQSPAVDPDAPDAFRFAELGKLVRILERAGATDVTEDVIKFDIAAPLSPEEFWTMRSEVSETLREKLRNISQEEREQIAAEVQEAVKDFFPEGHMRFPAQMIVVTGSKPR